MQNHIFRLPILEFPDQEGDDSSADSLPPEGFQDCHSLYLGLTISQEANPSSADDIVPILDCHVYRFLVQAIELQLPRDTLFFHKHLSAYIKSSLPVSLFRHQSINECVHSHLTKTCNVLSETIASKEGAWLGLYLFANSRSLVDSMSLQGAGGYQFLIILPRSSLMLPETANMKSIKAHIHTRSEEHTSE